MSSDIKTNRSYVKDRAIRTIREDGDVVRKSKRVVTHFTPLSPLEKVTGSGDPWRINADMYVHSVLNVVLFVAIVAISPLFLLLLIPNAIRTALLAYGWTGKQFQARLANGSSVVLWASSSDQTGKVVDLVERYVEKIGQLRVAAERANASSTLPDAYEASVDEAQRFIRQVQSVLNAVIDSRVSAKSSTKTILNDMIREMTDRVEKIENLLSSEAYRNVEMALRPKNMHTLDAQIEMIQRLTNATLAIGSGLDHDDESPEEAVERQMEELRRRSPGYGAKVEANEDLAAFMTPSFDPKARPQAMPG